jgi:hypothetical protein
MKFILFLFIIGVSFILSHSNTQKNMFLRVLNNQKEENFVKFFEK